MSTFTDEWQRLIDWEADILDRLRKALNQRETLIAELLLIDKAVDELRERQEEEGIEPL